MTFDSENRRAFWYHYNKPESRRQKRNVLTLHCKGQCLLVYDIDCRVPTKTRHRKTQPHCGLAGHGRVHITGKTALIAAS